MIGFIPPPIVAIQKMWIYNSLILFYFLCAMIKDPFRLNLPFQLGILARPLLIMSLYLRIFITTPLLYSNIMNCNISEGHVLSVFVLAPCNNELSVCKCNQQLAPPSLITPGDGCGPVSHVRCSSVLEF